MSKLARPLLLAVALGAVAFAPAPLRAAESRNEARATFLLLLGQYVTWPAGAFAAPGAPLVISIVGDPALSRELSGIAAGQAVEGHPVQVRAAADVGSAAGSHIVFVTKPEDARALANASPLRVSEQSSRVADTDIAIRVEGERIAFAVNRRALGARGLKLSSKLMRLASSFD